MEDSEQKVTENSNGSDTPKESPNKSSSDDDHTLDSLKKKLRSTTSGYEMKIAMLEQKIENYETERQELVSERDYAKQMHSTVLQVN
jgi:hypothetical protein